ncbi:low-density lipoprotein receptor-related protein 1, partial [Plakobranchus ocellatus]
ILDCRREPRLCSPNAECVEGAGDEYVCVCRSGYRGDGARCSAASRNEGNYLVYAQGNKIMRISADESSGDIGEIIAYEPGMLAVGVEIDCQEGDVYWTDAAKGVIKRSKLNGSDMQNIVNGMKSPEGIAIDFVARNMFFTDSEMDSLMVSKLNGSDMKTLVNTDMLNPRAIVLDIDRG